MAEYIACGGRGEPSERDRRLIQLHAENMRLEEVKTDG